MAARKLACIVWGVLNNGKAYVEEDKYLTMKKMHAAQLSIKSKRGKHGVHALADELSMSSNILSKYEERRRRHKYRGG
ncbi:MAG: hypothetical protein JRN00_08535 [Nitrososphaerota archaeon]|nr:hypothetical protein [Nitrososphaerota archaeon]